MPTINRYYDRYDRSYRWVVSESMLVAKHYKYSQYPRQAQFAEVVYGEKAEAVARAFAQDAAERGWSAAYAALDLRR